MVPCLSRCRGQARVGKLGSMGGPWRVLLTLSPSDTRVDGAVRPVRSATRTVLETATEIFVHQAHQAPKTELLPSSELERGRPPSSGSRRLRTDQSALCIRTAHRRPFSPHYFLGFPVLLRRRCLYKIITLGCAFLDER